MIASLAAGSVKIGQEQSQRPLANTIDDLPSDISVDEWGEVQKYGQILHIEAMRKEFFKPENKYFLPPPTRSHQ